MKFRIVILFVGVAAAVLLLLLFECTRHPQSTPAVWSGPVTYITDGDTIRVKSPNDGVEIIRLHGVDCPELDQPYGNKAKRFVLRLLLGQTVSVHEITQDKYGRTVARIYLQDEALGNKLVAAGLAWWYERYAPNNSTLKALQAKAKKADRGLWAADNPIPPWDWRRGAR